MENIIHNTLSISRQSYGTLHGKNVYGVSLKNESLRIELTNIGCSIMAIYAIDRDGTFKNVVAGFTDFKDYEKNPHYLGCVLGRYANRIAGGRFSINDSIINLTVNDGANHLHGGVEGFNKKIWEITSSYCNTNQASVSFEYLSPDGEEGYPGNLHVKVKYTLDKLNKLSIEYYARTDKPSPVNLSNHSYFNLSGFDTPHIKNHTLCLNAKSYTEKNVNNVPSGKILPVEGTALDFTSPKRIGKDIDKFPADKGFDHNFILEKKYQGELGWAAQLKEPISGRTLDVYTDKPAMQVYSANLWDGNIKGQHGVYQQHGAVALETQAFPDSPNQPSFPNTILEPDKTYFSTTVYQFGLF